MKASHHEPTSRARSAAEAAVAVVLEADAVEHDDDEEEDTTTTRDATATTTTSPRRPHLPRRSENDGEASSSSLAPPPRRRGRSSRRASGDTFEENLRGPITTTEPSPPDEDPEAPPPEEEHHGDPEDKDQDQETIVEGFVELAPVVDPGSASLHDGRDHDDDVSKKDTTDPHTLLSRALDRSWPWLLGLLALSTLGVLATYVARSVRFARGVGTDSSAAGTATTTNNGGTARRARLASLLERRGYAGPSTFLDPTSPRARALDWIAYRDEVSRGLDPETVDGANIILPRYALILLAYSTSVELWRTVDPWTSATTTGVCDGGFVGVSCDDANGGEVTSIDVQFQRLSGTLPPELACLTAVEYLDVSRNLLVGSLPEELYDLTQLTHLDLNSNELGSTLSPSIRKLSGLEFLYVGRNRLTGTLPAEALASLTHLRFFGMEDMPVSGPIYEVALNWPNLGFLLWNGMAPRPDPIPAGIGSLTRLTELILGDVRLPLPTELGLLSGLENLELFLADEDPPNHNNTTIDTALVALLANTIPTELGRLSNLSRLVVLDTYRLTGTLPTELGRLTSLERLDVSYTGLGGGLPTELAGLTNLRVLKLQENDGITGSFPTQLGSLAKNLDRIILQGIGLEGTMPPAFCGSGVEGFLSCYRLGCNCCEFFRCLSARR